MKKKFLLVEILVRVKFSVLNWKQSNAIYFYKAEILRFYDSEPKLIKYHSRYIFYYYTIWASLNTSLIMPK